MNSPLMKEFRLSRSAFALLAVAFALSNPACFGDQASDFLGDLEKTIEKTWKEEGHALGRAPSLRFKIKKDGRISHLQIYHSSGDVALDEDGLETIRKLVPFRAPPKGVKEIRTIFNEVDFVPYMADMQRKIYKYWIWPKEDKTPRITVCFTIHDNGKISNLRLDKSSGIKAADKAALKAVRKAAPFMALPDGAPVTVETQFTFDFGK